MLVVTPNLCFDRTLRVEHFDAGAIVRPYDVVVAAGGKGVNVCRALADLGARAQLVGLVGRDDEARFTALARAEDLPLVTVTVDGEVRTATIIVEDSGRATVLNEPGAVVGPAEADALCERAATLLDGAGTLACSGSLPPGMPTDLYGRLSQLAREHGARSVVDGAREALAHALAGEPDLVTPNLHEAEGVIADRAVETSHDDGPLAEVQERAFAMAEALRERGARRALVTAGAHGAAYVGDDDRTWVSAPEVEVRNPIGAGDALVAGVGHALERGDSWLDAARWGVTVASAAVEHPTAGRLDVDRANELAAGRVVA